MSKNLQPGMLCLIVGSESVPENIGRQCTLIQRLRPGDTCVDPTSGIEFEVGGKASAVWLVHGNGLFCVERTLLGRKVIPDNYPIVAEKFLMPLKGDESSQEIEQQEELTA